MHRSIIAAAGLLAVAACAHAPGARLDAPDVVLTGGKVFTAVSARPWAEAVAIRGERIVAVGTTAEVARLAGPSTPAPAPRAGEASRSL